MNPSYSSFGQRGQKPDMLGWLTRPQLSSSDMQEHPPVWALPVASQEQLGVNSEMIMRMVGLNDKIYTTDQQKYPCRHLLHHILMVVTVWKNIAGTTSTLPSPTCSDQRWSGSELLISADQFWVFFSDQHWSVSALLISTEQFWSEKNTIDCLVQNCQCQDCWSALSSSDQTFNKIISFSYTSCD